MTDALLVELQAALPDAAVVVDTDVLDSYRSDQATWVEAGKPSVAVLPRTTAQVSTVLRAAAKHGVPVVPRGAGSGLSGGASAVDGCVVVCLSRMDRIIDAQPADQWIEVEPGVLNAAVTEAVRDAGLWYPPDPASKAFSTIGGNVATNAGGLCCVKYGVTRDYVLGLEVVLADGRVVETGRRTVKGVAGLDLTGLFVGSGGELGVVTRVRLRLRPAAPAPATVVAFFPTLVSAGDAVAALTLQGVVPSMLELLDAATIAAVDDWTRMGLDRDAAALLLAQSDAAGDGRVAEVARMAETFRTAGATFVAETADPAEGEELLAARRMAYPALERLGSTLLDDVAVPRTKVPALLAAVERIADRHGVLVGTFGHAGDGNMHPTIVVPHGDDVARRRGQEAFDDIVTVALELGGTITGEHGVGVLKRHQLERELGSDVLSLQRAIKAALDPAGLLNPGKVLS